MSNTQPGERRRTVQAGTRQPRELWQRDETAAVRRCPSLVCCFGRGEKRNRPRRYGSGEVARQVNHSEAGCVERARQAMSNEYSACGAQCVRCARCVCVAVAAEGSARSGTAARRRVICGITPYRLPARFATISIPPSSRILVICAGTATRYLLV